MRGLCGQTTSGVAPPTLNVHYRCWLGVLNHCRVNNGVESERYLGEEQLASCGMGVLCSPLFYA